MVSHNHSRPSRQGMHVSKADLAATEELRDLAKRLDVPLLDHLILGAGGEFLSLAEDAAGDS